MTNTADFIVIGGGIAGLSVAARLAEHGQVVVLEAEDAVGYHSSGRSAAFYHFGLGNPLVRGLTAWSRPFFDAPPEGFTGVPLATPKPALFIATEEMRPDLDALGAEMRRFTDTVEDADIDRMRALCPLLRFGPDAIVAGLVDHGGRSLDADALLQGFARKARSHGTVLVRHRVATLARTGRDWTATTEAGDSYTAPVIVNAAGSWADRIAGLAGVQPIGLQPKRRTIIVFDPPEGTEVRDWPFIKTPGDVFYILPQGNRLLACPNDETDSEPCDAQAEEYDQALAAWRVEQFTTMPVPRITGSWAGLRSFVKDRMPVAGFAPEAPGFFWLVGQGGFGLQTSPAMSALAAALVTGHDWPAGMSELGVTPESVSVERLRG
ncbi:FAD-binding oxidoreductase [Chakrabartia godavariana]|nr:FAD-binding oxidoreductase [Chakrabartia godavariana]